MSKFFTNVDLFSKMLNMSEETKKRLEALCMLSNTAGSAILRAGLKSWDDVTNYGWAVIGIQGVGRQSIKALEEALQYLGLTMVGGKPSIEAPNKIVDRSGNKNIISSALDIDKMVDFIQVSDQERLRFNALKMLPDRALNVISRLGLETFEEIAAFGWENFMYTRNCAIATAEAINGALLTIRLELAGEIPTDQSLLQRGVPQRQQIQMWKQIATDLYLNWCGNVPQNGVTKEMRDSYNAYLKASGLEVDEEKAA